MDFLMPRPDGAELVRLLSAEADLASTPVIFLTGKESASDRERLLALGARGVIVKPFDPEALPREVERLLAARVDSDSTK